MKLAYHAKNDNHGWRHIKTAPISCPEWHDADRWAYNFMIDNGEQVLTIGWNMYQLINDKATT
jgi:hypothetical protein